MVPETKMKGTCGRELLRDAERGKPVELGHREVAQDELRRALRERAAQVPLRADRVPARLQALLAQRAHRQLDVELGILDEQDVYRLVAHSASAFSPTGCCARGASGSSVK